MAVPVRLLLALASIASVAYLKYRSRGDSAILRKDLPLSSLGHQLRNWLPNLDFLQFVRIEVAGTGDSLQIEGDGKSMDVTLPQTTARQRSFRRRFEQTCSRFGFEAQEVRRSDGGRMLMCTVPADQAAVIAMVEALLRELFDVHSESKLIAAVPR
jgi:putative hemolysin